MKRGPKRREICLEKIREAVAASHSIAGVLRYRGLRVAGANYHTVKRAVAELKLDTSHWTGQGHRKGSTVPVKAARPLHLILRKGTWCTSSRLKARLLDAGMLQPKCSFCGMSEWLRQPIPLELDHIDGDRSNHLLENLRLLCPNCHAMTPTYRGKNIKIRRS
jgi:hypothetical protein